MLKAPCENCPDRHLGCHSECEKYIAYDIVNGILRDQALREKELNYDLLKTSRHAKQQKRRRAYADSRGGQ